MIVGLFTGLLAEGGVERSGRHTAAVLVSFAKERQIPILLFSLNDTIGVHRIRVGEIDLTVRGFGRSKIKFILSVLAVAPRTNYAFMSHPNLTPLGLLLRILRPGLRYWVATHGIDVWEPLPFWRRIGLRAAFRLTAPSQYTARLLSVAQGLHSGKIVVIPWALDRKIRDLGNRPEIQGPPGLSGTILLTVARLAASERYKGVDTVIQALPAVVDAVPGISYVVVGDGDDRERLEHLAEKAGVEKNVFFVGFRSEEELAGYYRSSQIFLLPSKAEGFGLVFLEAMSFGKPVIGGRHGGTPEVIEDGVTGFLIKYGDSKSLADCVINLLKDEELREKIGDAARRRVEEHYAFDLFFQRMKSLISEVIHG